MLAAAPQASNQSLADEIRYHPSDQFCIRSPFALIIAIFPYK
jgi:hypothetical protein